MVPCSPPSIIHRSTEIFYKVVVLFVYAVVCVWCAFPPIPLAVWCQQFIFSPRTCWEELPGHTFPQITLGGPWVTTFTHDDSSMTKMYRGWNANSNPLQFTPIFPPIHILFPLVFHELWESVLLKPTLISSRGLVLGHPCSEFIDSRLILKDTLDQATQNDIRHASLCEPVVITLFFYFFYCPSLSLSLFSDILLFSPFYGTVRINLQQKRL